MTKKAGGYKIMMILIVLLLAASAYATPVFDTVNFTDPLGSGETQTVKANISSANSLTSVLLQTAGSNYSMSLNGGIYEYSWSPPNGTVNFKIYAIDNQSNTTAYEDSFEVKDLTPPSILSKLPTGIITSETVDLELTTDEDADCKYDTENSTYSGMGNFFAATGGTTHSSLLTHIPSGERIYYVACKDTDQNIVYGAVAFEVNLPPSARVVISENSPLKADTYEINIITSKPLSEVPKLQYKYDDSASYNDISLSGSDDYWTGYLVIPDSSNDRIAKFYFTGKDYDGLTGGKITSGEMFIVDTSKPPAPTSIEAIIEDDDIEINWFYEGEEVDYFNIYRSTVAGVEYVDYYDKENDEVFTDTDVDNGETYYYRVVAIDKAGNVGALSSEVHILFEDNGDDEDDEPIEKEKLSSSLEVTLNKTYSDVRTMIFDVEFTRSQLEKEKERAKADVIAELKLLDSLNSARANLENILKELDLLRGTDLSESEFNEKLQNAEAKIDKIKEDTVSDVLVLDTFELTQSFSESEIHSVVNEVFLKINIDKGLKENYTRDALILQEQITVYQKITIAKLTTINDEDKYVTIVGKEVSSSKDLLDVILVEKIPKTFSESSNDIGFSASPKILKEDPVVYWDYPKFQGAEFSYSVDKKRGISDARDAHTLILPNPSNFGPKVGVYSSEGDGKLTGNAVFNGEGRKQGFKEFIFLAVGLFIIGGLVVYYFFFIKEPDEGSSHVDYYNNLKNESPQAESQVMPTEAAPVAEEPSEESYENKHLRMLMEHADFHIQNSNFEQAKKEYSFIYELFNSINFSSPEERAQCASKITLLHKKIAKNLASEEVKD